MTKLPGEIAIVDDTAMNVLVLEQMIRKKLKRSCITFSSGEDAVLGIEKWKRERDELGQTRRLLLLMDVNMPTMSGAEATQRIRAMFGDAEDIRRRKEVVVIAATGQEREDV